MADFQLTRNGQNQRQTTLALPPSQLTESICVQKYLCVICGFIYDEALGLPEEGIPPETRFDDLPLNWFCPDCSARKEDFELIVD